jgi:alpha-D-ribose 1-methylphosphonate 5-triphosphate synthase subunit PhnH
MVKEISFDFIYDAQREFRVLLNAFSHPGILYSFSHYALNTPKELYESNAIIAFTLFDNNISFYAANNYSLEIESYLHLNTNANSSAISKADYVFLNGILNVCEYIKECNKGDLLFPEKSTTIILSVEAISNEPITDFDFQINVEGPGVKHTNTLFIKGIDANNLHKLKNVNSEFPLGIDLILTDSLNNISAIPRSALLEFIQKN